MGHSRQIAILIAFSLSLRAEVHRLSLREAIDLVAQQNPEVILARLQEQRAAQSLTIQKDPFYPKIFAGSGAAWSSGYPQSIDGNAPSIAQERVVMSLYNKPLSLRIAQARENQRGPAPEAATTAEDAIYEVAIRYLDAEQNARAYGLQSKQAASLNSILQTVRARVDEGRSLPLDQKKAELNLAVANDKSLELQMAQEASEIAVANLLGYPPGDRVQPTKEDRPPVQLPETEVHGPRQRLRVQQSPKTTRVKDAIEAA